MLRKQQVRRNLTTLPGKSTLIISNSNLKRKEEACLRHMSKLKSFEDDVITWGVYPQRRTPLKPAGRWISQKTTALSRIHFWRMGKLVTSFYPAGLVVPVIAWISG